MLFRSRSAAAGFSALGLTFLYRPLAPLSWIWGANTLWRLNGLKQAATPWSFFCLVLRPTALPFARRRGSFLPQDLYLSSIAGTFGLKRQKKPARQNQRRFLVFLADKATHDVRICPAYPVGKAAGNDHENDERNGYQQSQRAENDAGHCHPAGPLARCV